MRSSGFPTTLGRSFAAEAENRPSRAAVIDLGKQRDRKRSSRLKRHDAVSFPTAQDSRNQPSSARYCCLFQTAAHRSNSPTVDGEHRNSNVRVRRRRCKLFCGKFGSPALLKKFEASSIDLDHVYEASAVKPRDSRCWKRACRRCNSNSRATRAGQCRRNADRVAAQMAVPAAARSVAVG